MVRGCITPEREATALEKYAGPSSSFSEYKRMVRASITLCGSVGTIEVENNRIALRSGLENDTEGRAAGDAFCQLVQGSDVADFTPGHELQDKDGETIKVCPARND